MRRLAGLALFAEALDSTNTISWSPRPGRVVQRVVNVGLLVKKTTLLSNFFSWTPAPSSLHHTNYKQLICSSVDHDQMAFEIQKEINLGSTRLNCYHYY